MENTQKPSSTVTLWHDHGFTGPHKAFLPEMLDWPIYDSFFMFQTGKLVDEDLTHIIRTALTALTQISPFEAFISMGVRDGKDKFLYLAKRMWLQIILKEQSVLQISHDIYDHPFSQIYEWPELKGGGDEVVAGLRDWKVEAWIGFFERKLQDRAVFLKQKAYNKMKDVMALKKEASNIRVGLTTILLM